MAQTQPPKLNPARRNPRVGVVTLPAGGYHGVVPSWPLPGRQLKAEKATWADLWSSPQAHAWAQMGPATIRMVARYTRLLLNAEAMNKDALAEARQVEDRLGISPKAMRMLLWVIGPDDAEPEVEAKSATVTGIRSRIRAVG